MYKGYSWSCLDVMSLLSIKVDERKEEAIIRCPFCGGKRFGMNIKKGTGRCFNCGQTADSASYYAADTGMSLNNARDDIKRRLNIRDANNNLPERKVFKEIPEEELAPVKARDKAYRAFLDELILNEKNYMNLLARGFSSDDIEARGYKTFPSATTISFEDLCRRIQSKGISLKGIPGFYTKPNGEYTFVRITPGIIIPQININNLIEGLQIRKDEDLRMNTKSGELEAKCVWFSSKNYPGGTGAHVSIHISTDFKYDMQTKEYIPILHGNRVTLTEGGMKADLCNSLLDYKGSFISVAGVYSTKPLKETLIELKKYGLKTVNIAFDMDYLTNKNVKDSMIKVTNLIKELDLNCENIMNWEYKITEDEGSNKTTFYLKGLDDYLAYQYKRIKPVIIKRGN